VEILILSFITAISYLVVITKIFGLGFVTRTQVLWDVLFTVGVPLLFTGTFSGMATGVLSGLMFSIMLSFISMLSGNRKVTL
jgi:hypothetical protein